MMIFDYEDTIPLEGQWQSDATGVNVEIPLTGYAANDTLSDATKELVYFSIKTRPGNAYVTTESATVLNKIYMKRHSTDTSKAVYAIKEYIAPGDYTAILVFDSRDTTVCPTVVKDKIYLDFKVLAKVPDETA